LGSVIQLVNTVPESDMKPATPIFAMSCSVVSSLVAIVYILANGYWMILCRICSLLV
jgi:hypothetical protein